MVIYRSPRRISLRLFGSHFSISTQLNRTRTPLSPLVTLRIHQRLYLWFTQMYTHTKRSELDRPLENPSPKLPTASIFQALSSLFLHPHLLLLMPHALLVSLRFSFPNIYINIYSIHRQKSTYNSSNTELQVLKNGIR